MLHSGTRQSQFARSADDRCWRGKVRFALASCAPKTSRLISAPLRLVRLASMAAALWGCTERQRPQEPLVRIAELEIDAAHLANYKAAVTEEIETSLRVEPGVLAIYSVAL